MAHVSTVFRRCGALHNSLVCCHISDNSILNSFGFRMLNVRTDLLVRREIVLILSLSFRLFIYTIENNRVSFGKLEWMIEKIISMYRIVSSPFASIFLIHVSQNFQSFFSFPNFNQKFWAFREKEQPAPQQ